MLTVTNLKIQGENMDKIQLFRRRYIPDEIKELKDDIVLSVTDDMILTKWNVLKPRKDIARGVSAYFIDKGIKVSKLSFIINTSREFRKRNSLSYQSLLTHNLSYKSLPPQV